MFRDPLTTAAGVDTGSSPTGPGVRMYQETAGAFPRGVVEYRDGIAGDVAARLELETFLTILDPETGVLNPLGNEFRMIGGQTRGVTPARFVLSIDDTGAGYESRATLSNVSRATTGTAWRHTDGRTLITPNTAIGWQNDGTAGVPDLYVLKEGAGTIHCRGMLRNRSAAAIAAASTLGTIPATYRPATTVRATCWSTGGAVAVDVTAAGALQFAGGTAIAVNSYIYVHLSWPTAGLES